MMVVGCLMLGVDNVSFGLLGVDGVFKGVGCLMLGVDEMIRWLIKIIYNMSWHFICFLLFLSEWRVDF